MAGAAGDGGRGFVDVNTVFGPAHGTAGTAGAPLDLLVAERRSHGIRLSLASSLLAIWADGLTGNRIVHEAAGGPGERPCRHRGHRSAPHRRRRAARRRGRTVGRRRLPARWLGRNDSAARSPSARSCGPWPRPAGRCSSRSCASERRASSARRLTGWGSPSCSSARTTCTSSTTWRRRSATRTSTSRRARWPTTARSRPSPGRSAPSECCSGRGVPIGRQHRRSARSSRHRSRTTPSARSSAATPIACSAWPKDRSISRWMRVPSGHSMSTRTSGLSISTCRRSRTPTWSAGCASRERRPRSPPRPSRSSVTRSAATPRWPAPLRPATATACTGTWSPIRPTWTRVRTSCGATWTHPACSV